MTPEWHDNSVDVIESGIHTSAATDSRVAFAPAQKRNLPWIWASFFCFLFLINSWTFIPTVLIKHFVAVFPPAIGSARQIAFCLNGIMVLLFISFILFFGMSFSPRDFGLKWHGAGGHVLRGVGYAIAATVAGVIITLALLTLVSVVLSGSGWSSSHIRHLFVQWGGRERETSAFVRSGIGLVQAVGVVPVMEELIFRGVFFGGLRQKVSFPVAACLSAALFTMLHFYIIGAPMIFIMGLFAAYARERHDSLIPCIALHAAWNLKMFLFLAVWK